MHPVEDTIFIPHLLDRLELLRIITIIRDFMRPGREGGIYKVHIGRILTDGGSAKAFLEPMHEELYVLLKPLIVPGAVETVAPTEACRGAFGLAGGTAAVDLGYLEETMFGVKESPEGLHFIADDFGHLFDVAEPDSIVLVAFEDERGEDLV